MAVPRVLRIFKVREEGNLEFWVSNLVIVMSTILGVYLAAQAGYATAVNFERVRNDREGYYMRKALLDELKDNLDQADKTSTWVAKDGWRMQGGSADAFKPQNYVWEAMKESTVTFAIPADVLTGVRRYYAAAEVVARQYAIGQGTAMDGAKQSIEEVKKVREGIVPALERDIERLRGNLSRSGFPVE
jgi:hypothetical protein